jgi:hypothetical protein
MTIAAILESLRGQQEPQPPVPVVPAAPHPPGWSDRLGRQVYEPVPGHPGQWRETAASAALCIWCPEPLAEGDKIGCAEHRREGGAARAEPFVPSSEWQVVPDGYPCPPSGEFRMDFATGTNWGRWPCLGGGGP